MTARQLISLLESIENIREDTGQDMDMHVNLKWVNKSGLDRGFGFVTPGFIEHHKGKEIA